MRRAFSLFILSLFSVAAFATPLVVVDDKSTTLYIEPTQDLPNAGTPLDWTLPVYNVAGDNGKGDTGNGNGLGNWQSGRFRLGFADGDDATLIENDGAVNAVYTRTNFTVANAASILAMRLFVDYDDGYVVWLNGVEVSRSSNMAGINPPRYNSTFVTTHESTFRWGTQISLDASLGSLATGNNVLAVGIWNNAANSSDLSGRVRLVLHDAAYVPEPRHTYLTWQGDTSTTITVNYQTDSAAQSKVYFDTVSHGGNIAAYPNVITGAAHQIPGMPVTRYIHWVQLTGLTPGQTYYFVAGDNGVARTPELKFKTIPSGNEPLRFAQGGDMSTAQQTGQVLTAASFRDPQFVAFGGDCAYEDGNVNSYGLWDTVIQYYDDNLVTSDGLTVPLIVGIGNHETVGGWVPNTPSPATAAPFYYNYFAQDPGMTLAYFSRSFGSNTIFYMLDSGHTAPMTGTQATWLGTTMAANAAFANQFAMYHVPMYPSHRSYTSDANVPATRAAWRPTFDQYGLDTAFENHDHMFKRTKFLKNEQIDVTGTMYVGDGSIGQTPRTGDQGGRWYLDQFQQSYNIWVVDVPGACVPGAKPVYRGLDEEGRTLDRFTTNANAAVPATILPAGSTWKYLDNNNGGVDPGTAWYGTAFVDTGWASGPAELGYGDGGEATVVGGAGLGYITTWFRNTFNVANPANYGALKLRLKRDDGAVVYLNGYEIYRTNMDPAAAITYASLATQTVGGTDETTFFDSPLIQNILVAGNNTLAVEIHQVLGSSSDISFDLELQGLPPTSTTLIPYGATWKYLDTNTNLDSTALRPYTKNSYNDTAWASGPAQLGYGDGDEATVVSFGGNAAAKYITTYFRHTFTENNPERFRAFALKLLRDDGVIVYLNGAEVFRSNMPTDVTVTNATLAPVAVDGASETVYSPVFNARLLKGNNVVAVALHQNAAGSSDISFDLQLVGIAGESVVTASAGANGSIAPSGNFNVQDGANQAFTLTPSVGYHVADLLVDCKSVGAVSSYTLNSVDAPHVLAASFAINTYDLTASAGTGGSISPPGVTTVNYNINQTYTIVANVGFVIADVLVDGVSQGAVGSYTFNNVSANHTISAGFTPLTYTITASAGANGSVTPAGATIKNFGSNQTYTITPDVGYNIADVLVDGVSVGAVPSYTFSGIVANHTISATFVIQTFTITASAGANGSVTPAGATVKNFGTSQAYTIVANIGFVIADVLVDGVSVGAVGSYTFNSIAANHTISASFTPLTYTITASTGANGSVTPAGATIKNFGTNQTYTITPALGYNIANVLVDGVSVGAVPSYTFSSIVANHTISATFAIQTFTITASAGANGSVTPAGATIKNFGTNQAYTITPALGYNIADVLVNGVSVGAVPTYTFSSIAANHTISASFVIQTFTITASAGANGSITPNGVTTVNYNAGQAYTITPAPTYKIANVLVDGVSVGTGGTYTFSNVTANRTISASFTLQTFSVTASAGPNGTIFPSGVATVTYGNNRAYTITPALGHNVADVLVDGVSVGAVTNYTFLNVTTIHTISASFVPQTFTISASAGANGNITPNGASSVNYNTSHAYTITPAPGYSVANVLVDGNSVGAVTNYTFNNVTAAHTISATFAIQTYTITATAGANGSISPSGATVQNFGGTQAYTITPALGYNIADVLADGVSVGAVGTYTFSSIAANHTIAASFAIQTFNITASAGANGSIFPAGNVSVNYNGAATFSITPDVGYAILDVLVDGNSVGAVSSHTFSNVTAAHTIAASFQVNLDPLIFLTQPPDPVETSVGDTVVFTVSISGGVGPYTYAWQRQLPDLSFVAVGDDSPVLTLVDVGPADEGIYFCEVSDGVDLIRSNGSRLSFVPGVPIHAAWAALALGGLGLVWIRRRKG